MTQPIHIEDELVQLLDAHAGTAAESYLREAQERLHPPRQPGTAGPAEGSALDPSAIAGLIDHTQLAPDATDTRIRQSCAEARTYEFAAVCVHPCYVPLVHQALAGSSIAVCTVVGFPHGANRSAVKAFEAERAVHDGATEVDMVLSIGRLKSMHLDAVEADIRAVVDAVRHAKDEAQPPPIVKVILETAVLTNAEKAVACIAAHRAGADFVKTSTGFAAEGATTHDVALMRQIVGENLGVKAAGGIGSVDDVRNMVAHGATRIGASGGVAIMQGITSQTNY
jgi:deoxyribose-phosphate aldolase